MNPSLINSLDSLSKNTECPRCRQLVACRADDIQNCSCQLVTLTATQRAYMMAHYQGCLCADCLREIQHKVD